jgi:hypothetical protein
MVTLDTLRALHEHDHKLNKTPGAWPGSMLRRV